MAKKAAMPSYKTVDDYINSQSEAAQPLLHELRSLIKEAVPETTELENYKVPSFTLVQGAKPKQQLMVVAYAKFVSFYPHQAAVDYFANELKYYDLGKGTVKFSFNEPLPSELIKQMVIFRKQELLNKQQ